MKTTGAVILRGDASSFYFVVQPSTAVPSLRLYSLAGTLAGKVRVGSGNDLSDVGNCEFVLMHEPKVPRKGGAGKKQHIIVMQERVGLMAAKRIEPGEEMRVSINSVGSVA
jgi:hypothetical protein